MDKKVTNKEQALKKYSYFFESKTTSWIEADNSQHKYCLIDDTATVTKENTLILCNVTECDDILKIEKKNYYKRIFPWNKDALYLYFDENVFTHFIANSLEDINKIMDRDRIVILVGMDAFKHFFESMETVLPNLILGNECKQVKEEISFISQKREKILDDAKTEIKAYYEGKEETIIEHIRSGNPKILFLDTRFVEGKRVHYCYEACRDLGYDCSNAIQSDNIYRIYYELFINESKPDIIFVANRFRFQYSYLPSVPIFVTWRTDWTPAMLDYQTPKKLLERDILFDVCTGYNSMKIYFGYENCEIYKLPLPGNEKIYKPYTMTEEEWVKYSCDISFVANNADIKSFVRPMLDNYDDSINLMFDEIIPYLYKRCDEDNYFSKEKEAEPYLDSMLIKYNIKKGTYDLKLLREQLWIINYAIQKTVLAKWLIEKGNCSIKLWGMGWENMEEFKPYAMGYAQEGEELAKIHYASKIAMGNHGTGSIMSRVTEIIFSKGFMLKNPIPPEIDQAPLEPYFEVGKDIIIYRGKKDLYEKIDYYLSHENERKQVIENAYKKALQSLTYTKTIENVMEKIAEIYC